MEIDWKNSHIVNLFNGLLNTDGDSWAQLLQTLALNSSAFDSKYGKTLDMLLCTSSDAELAAKVDQMNTLMDVFTADGKVGSLLSKISESKDTDVKILYNKCQAALDQVKNGYSELVDLSQYLANSSSQYVSSDSMRKSMQKYAKSLNTSIGEYSLKKYFKNNVLGWIKKGVKFDKALGNQANIELLVWDLASNHIPFLSDGISAADKFELAVYAGVFQSDTFRNYQNYRDQIFAEDTMLTSQNLYTLSQYCNLYLKSCYITRDAALSSLQGKSSSTKKKIQSLIKDQQSVNNEIARHLIDAPGNSDNII